MVLYWDTIITKHKRQVNFELLRIIAMLMIITLHYLDKGGILPTWIQEVERPLGGLTSGPELIAMFLEAFCLPAVNVFVLLPGYFGLHNSRTCIAAHTIAHDTPENAAAADSAKPSTAAKQAGNQTASAVSLARIRRLWLTVVFYSVAIAISALVFGLTSAEDISVYFIVETVFPVLTNQYWFATSFILLMLFTPFLARGMEQLSRKDYQLLLAVLLGYFSVAKTVLFFYWLPLDSGGYDVLWFIVLYLLGGYIARFGIPFADTAGKAALLYVIPSLMIPLVTLILRYVNLSAGSFESVTDYAYTYNHVLCVLSAVGLFALFRAAGTRAADRLPAEGEDSRAAIVRTGDNAADRLPTEGEAPDSTIASAGGKIDTAVAPAGGAAADRGLSVESEDPCRPIAAAGAKDATTSAKPEGPLPRLVRIFASAVFGVYLIHEHPALRYAWPRWFHTEDFAGSPLFLFHWLLTVPTVFLVCAGIDLLRQKLAGLRIFRPRNIHRADGL